MASNRPKVPHEELQGKICLAVFALRKSWAKQNTYWIELYGQRIGPGRLRLWVYKHWFFRKRNELTGEKETIRDGVLAPEVCSTFRTACAIMHRWVERQLKNDYRISDYAIEPEDFRESILTLPEVEELRIHLTKINALTAMLQPLVVQPEHPEESVSDSLALRFRRAQEERAKKAKW